MPGLFEARAVYFNTLTPVHLVHEVSSLSCWTHASVSVYDWPREVIRYDCGTQAFQED